MNTIGNTEEDNEAIPATIEHTPGPWKSVHEEMLSRFIVKDAKDEQEIAVLQYEDFVDADADNFSMEEQEANARLIAAAPDMAHMMEVVAAELRCNKPATWKKDRTIREKEESLRIWTDSLAEMLEKTVAKGTNSTTHAPYQTLDKGGAA